MNTIFAGKFFGRYLFSQTNLILCAAFTLVTGALAEPRDTLPPWPEQTLGSWGFDHWHPPMLSMRAAIGIESAQMAESWSGYSLTRDLLAVSPVAIPVTDPYSGKRNFTTAQGTVRFWFCPNWSSASKESSGPGAYARLVELVSLSGDKSEVVYSLYLSPEGNVIYLSGQGVGGPTDFLKAEVNWTAGQWHLIALAYDEKQTTLFVDAMPVATGTAMPDVAQWKRDVLGLVIGSDLAAANVAQGQFDELCTFDSPLNADDLTWYWKAYRWTVALGPVGTEKEEWIKAEWIRAALQAESGVTNKEPTEVLAYRTRPEEYPTNALWLDIGGVTNGVVTMRLQGTVPGTMYEILSQENFRTNAGWQSEGVWIGTEGQDWTATPISVGTRTNQLFMMARSYQDSTGSGMPDWWQMQNFGQVGVDGYTDPDGDGWNNIQEYQNGTSPTAFNTPAAPQGVTVAYNSSNSAVTVNWLPSPGAVTGYVIERYISETGQDDWFTNSAGATSHFETFPIADPDIRYSSSFTVTALYSSGNSQPSAEANLYDPALSVQAILVRDANETLTLLASSVASQVGSLLLTRFDLDVPPGSPPSRTRFNIAVSNLQSGAYTLPTAWTTNGFGSFWAQEWYVQGTASGGRQGVPGYDGQGRTAAFKDGRTHLRQNLNFLLRAANVQSPFSYWVDDGVYSPYLRSNLTDYVYADFYDATRETSFGPPYLFPDRPFYDHYDYRNFVLNTTNVAQSGWLNTGVYNGNYGLTLYLPATFGYFADPNATNVPTLLPLPGTRNILQIWAPANFERPGIGVSESGSPLMLTLGANAKNIYGLPYLSMNLARPETNGLQFTTVSAGGSVAARSYNPGYLYPEIANPVLQNVGYYFCQPWYDPFPGYTNFSTANQSPTIICSVGDSWFHVAGYAKYAISNGYSGKYAYLGQYFDKVFKANPDGTRSTNETGMLSPYGEFFATEPGKTFLTTKPDGVSTNIGECVVNVIKLQLDVNHDGTMNTSWTGPDNTSWQKPFVFWVNNDFDRWHYLIEPDWGNVVDEEEDDLKTAGSPGTVGPTSDCNYQWTNGSYAIPSKRDLEDYTRLWVPGLKQMYEANTNLSFELSIRNNDTADGPAINLVLASDGDIRYLTNIVMASDQINVPYQKSIGRIGPGSSIRLDSFFHASLYPNTGADYFIWCGAKRGKGELVLQVKQGTNLLAETSAWLDLKDVKEMYERWSVGDDGSKPPTNGAYIAVEDIPTSTSKFLFSLPAATNTPYILHVHGWNMKTYDKDRYAETAFKRLYWQGYQGRFGSFRWPTKTGFTTFDASEFQAWQSGLGLFRLLTNLNASYPGRVYLTAHSLGNIVTAEALRLAGTNEVVNTFVALQAAVASHMFDSTTTNRSFAADDNTPDRHAEYWTNGMPCYLNGVHGAAHYANFFNPRDWALSFWETDQNTKPDFRYTWTYVPGENERYYYTDIFNDVTSLHFPQDTYKIYSFITEGRCYALGAQTNVAGPFTISAQVNLDIAPHNFGDLHKGHSAEFRSTYMNRWPFWEQLLFTVGLKPIQ